jgi:hypothetical protein
LKFPNQPGRFASLDDAGGDNGRGVDELITRHVALPGAPPEGAWLRQSKEKVGLILVEACEPRMRRSNVSLKGEPRHGTEMIGELDADPIRPGRDSRVAAVALEDILLGGVDEE